MMFGALGAVIGIIMTAGAIAFGRKSWKIFKGEDKNER
jgi:type IV secretory pathway VirB2 component (pilin)